MRSRLEKKGAEIEEVIDKDEEVVRGLIAEDRDEQMIITKAAP